MYLTVSGGCRSSRAGGGASSIHLLSVMLRSKTLRNGCMPGTKLSPGCKTETLIFATHFVNYSSSSSTFGTMSFNVNFVHKTNWKMILAMPYGLVKQTAVDNLNLRGAASDGYFHY